MDLLSTGLINFHFKNYNMLIEVENLEIGDEILVGANSQMKYLKVLRKPATGKKIHWRTKQPLYKTVLCSTHKHEMSYTNTYNNHTRTWTRNEFVCKAEDHNTNIYQNLNDRVIWLIKREN